MIAVTFGKSYYNYLTLNDKICMQIFFSTLQLLINVVVVALKRMSLTIVYSDVVFFLQKTPSPRFNTSHQYKKNRSKITSYDKMVSYHYLTPLDSSKVACRVIDVYLYIHIYIYRYIGFNRESTITKQKENRKAKKRNIK